MINSAYNVERMLAATATTVLTFGAGASNVFFDTGATVQRDGRTAEHRAIGGTAIENLMFDFEVGWFSNTIRVSGDDVFLKLKREPKTRLKLQNTVVILDWGVKLPADKASPEGIRNAVVRRYVMLEDKARRGVLTDEDRLFWKAMLADTDYGDFCQRTAPVVADIGKLISKTSEAAEVRWSGGATETVAGDFARQLAIVEVGESFSARVKFIDGRLTRLSNVVPLGSPEQVNVDDLIGAA